MKKLTSVTMHTTSEGQRLSYTYSIIDDDTGAVTSSNIRESMVVLDIESNAETLSNIESIKCYVNKRLAT